MATGGLPVPAIGATAYSLDVAKQFGLNVVDPRPALVPLSFTADNFGDLSELAGLSVPVRIASGSKGHRYGACRFNEDLLLTHKGLSGPAVLQASSYWEEGERKQLEERLQHTLADLQRSNDELERFAAVACHDLTEPLRSVSNYCQLLSKKYSEKLDEEGQQFITHAVNGAKRLTTLIQQLLEYSRVGSKA